MGPIHTPQIGNTLQHSPTHNNNDNKQHPVLSECFDMEAACR